MSDTVAIEYLIKCMPSSDLRGHIETAMTRSDLPQVPITERRNEAFKINGRVAISNAEILQCHTFTKCTVCVVVPPGYAIGDLCSPPELSGAKLHWFGRYH